MEHEIESCKTGTTKEEMDQITQALIAKPEGSDAKIEGIGDSIKNDTAVELYKRCAVINKELEAFKQLVVQGYRETGRELGLKSMCVSYDKRLQELERIKDKLDSDLIEPSKRQEAVISAVKAMQKAIEEKLKVKVNIDIPEMLAATRTKSTVPTSPRTLAKVDEHVAAKHSLLGQSSLAHVTRDISPQTEERIVSFAREFTKFATKESFEKLEARCKNMQTAIQSKVDKVRFDSLEQLMVEKVNKLWAVLEGDPDLAMSSKKLVNEISEGQIETKELVAQFSEKVI